MTQEKAGTEEDRGNPHIPTRTELEDGNETTPLGPAASGESQRVSVFKKLRFLFSLFLLLFVVSSFVLLLRLCVARTLVLHANGYT